MSRVGFSHHYFDQLAYELNACRHAECKNMARWSEDTTMKFVQEYLKHECLWDVRNEQYQNRQKRQLAYLKIEEVMAILLYYSWIDN